MARWYSMTTDDRKLPEVGGPSLTDKETGAEFWVIDAWFTITKDVAVRIVDECGAEQTISHDTFINRFISTGANRERAGAIGERVGTLLAVKLYPDKPHPDYF